MTPPNRRRGGPFRLASNTGWRAPAVRTTLVIPLEVDEHAVARLPRRWRGECLPPRTAVRIEAGRARWYLDYWGEIGSLVRECATVEIVGSEPQGVADVHQALTRALNAGVSPAC